jgi:predicted GNAT superfamily acetyltransferase
MLAVRPEAQGLHLGERLKEYQRDHCARLGIETIYWTFDPLVARNAHLNLNRMRARVDEFVAAMYGEGTNSPLQGDMPTDRFVIAWAVDPAPPPSRSMRIPDGTPLVVGHDAHEGPLGDAPRSACGPARHHRAGRGGHRRRAPLALRHPPRLLALSPATATTCAASWPTPAAAPTSSNGT